MATRSSIAVKHGDFIWAISCHWNGYIEYVGQCLQQHYLGSADELIARGNLSSLGARMDPSTDRLHTFDSPQEDVCVFYGRDRGDVDSDSRVFHTVAEYIACYDACEYHYLWQQEQWWVSQGGATFEPLSTVLANWTQSS